MINDILNNMNNITACPEKEDGLYIQLFAVKNGVRYDMKVVDMKEVSATLTNALMDGVEKLWKL